MALNFIQSAFSKLSLIFDKISEINLLMRNSEVEHDRIVVTPRAAITEHFEFVDFISYVWRVKH